MKKKIIHLINQLGLRNLFKSILRSFNLVSNQKVNNNSFKILSLYGSKSKISESWILDVFKTVFSFKSGAFIDIGVNLGQTLIEVKSIDPNKNYIGFEPNPACIFYVEELIRINKFKNTQLIPVGLFKENSILTLDLYADEITNSGGSLIKDFWEYKNWKVQRKLYVPVLSFATIKKTVDIPDFDVVKIDVEGAELEVLQTLAEELKSRKPIIIIEILSAYSEENKIRYDRQNSLLELIKELNYHILRININEKEKIESIEKIDFFDVNANPNNCNYILYHMNDEANINSHFSNYIS